ncbi:lysophospholipid acyltransferase family protein [Sphingomonas parva]|nr:lysophospholipid acyltransferase family protein [Sphingomonas parva]
MNLVRSIAFLIVFYSVTVVAILVAVPIGLVGGRPAVRAIARGWALYHRWCAAVLLGIRTRIEGAVPSGPVLIAAKHQSMYETMELVAILDNPGIVMKRELAEIPVWGRLARSYGLIPVERAGGATALRRMLRAAAETVAEGRPIVIFPEGTRVPVGETPPLQPGFAGLYRALDLPVVPLSLDSGKVWPRRSFVKRPGVVTMHFGEAIPPGLPRKDAEAKVHAAINAL